MGRRLFFVLPLLFVFSLLFVQVPEVGGTPAGTYTYTITKIGFYTPEEGSTPPQAENTIDLSSSQTVHEQFGGTTAPSISDFVYTGNIPNGSFNAIGCYKASSDEPGFTATWQHCYFDTLGFGVTHTFTDSSRKSITIINTSSGAAYATVTDL